MVSLLLDHTQLEIALARSERALAFRRESVRIERSAIVKVQLTDDPWTWVRGVRSRGTHVPGTIAMGTWRSHGSDDFVAVRGRRRPGVIIDLEGHPEFARVVVSTRHGLALARALSRDAGVADEAAAADAPAPAAQKAPVTAKGPRRAPSTRPAPAL